MAAGGRQAPGSRKQWRACPGDTHQVRYNAIDPVTCALIEERLATLAAIATEPPPTGLTAVEARERDVGLYRRPIGNGSVRIVKALYGGTS